MGETAEYTLRSPDGRLVTVRGPKGASQAQIVAAAKSLASKRAPTTRDTVGGLAGNYLDALIPGAAGAVRGVREMAVNAAQAPFSASVDFAPMKAYSRGQAFQAARQRAANAAHPTAANVISGAGLVGGLALPATRIAKGATLAQKSLSGAKTAGAYGTLSGAFSSKDESLLGRVGDAVSSGLSSAAVGLGLPYAFKAAGTLAAPAVRPIAQPATRMFGKGLEGIGDVIPGRIGNWMASEGRQLSRDPARAVAHAQIGNDIRAIPHPETGRPMRPLQVTAEVQRRHDLGVPAVPADLDDGLRRRFSSAARTPGPATSRVRQLVDERKQQEAARTVAHLEASLGPVGNVERQAEALSQQAREVAAPLYEQAYGQAIPVTTELQELFSRPGGRQAMDHASVALQNEGLSPFTSGRIEVGPGVWETGQVPTMQAYDYAKTALDDTAFAGRSPFATVEGTRDRRGALSIRQRLLGIMDGDGSGPPVNVPARADTGVQREISPEIARLPKAPPGVNGNLPVIGTTPGPWTGQRLHPEGFEAGQGFAGSAIPPEGLNPYWKPARDAYAGPVQDRKALELGEEMARADAVDASNRMDGMTGSQLGQFRLGHRSGFAGFAQGAPDYGDVARRIAGTAEKRGAIETVHGDDAAQALYDRLGPEQDASRTWKAVRPGATDQAPNIGEQDRQIEEAARGLLQTVTGRPGEGARSILTAIARGEQGGPEVQGRIAEVLGEGDLDKLQAAMREISRERARRTLVDLNAAKATQRGSRVFGSLLGTNLIEPVEDMPAY